MRRRSNSAAPWVTLMAAALGMAQTQPPKADEKPASVEGEVRNSVTGMPIARAHVSLRRSVINGIDRYGAMTNAEGKFRIVGIPPAAVFQLALDRVGYVASPEAMRTSVMLKADEKKDNFNLKMVPVGTISGRVFDADGQPADALAVRAEQGGRTVRTTITDDRGQYRIGGLSPGKYRVRAITQNFPMPPEIRTDGTTEVQNADTYHPGALDAKDATRVEVGPGSEVTGIDIRLMRTPIVRVAGKVSGLPEGAQDVYLMIQRRPVQEGGTGAQVRPDGSFEIWRLDPGKYTLRATVNHAGVFGASGALEVEVGDSDIDNIVLTVVAPEEIRGQLEFEDEAAKQGLQMPPRAQGTGGGQGGPGGASQTPPRPQRRIALHDLANMGQPNGEVSEDGAFTIPRVPPGKYTVRLMGYDGYVKSVRVGETASEGTLLDLSQGSGGARVTVTLSTAYGAIAGTVRDDKGPVAGAHLALWSTAGTGMTLFPTTQGDGTYSLKTLAPGTYKVLLMQEGDLEAMNQYLADESDERVETVEVRAKETATLDLRVAAK